MCRRDESDKIREGFVKPRNWAAQILEYQDQRLDWLKETMDLAEAKAQ